MSFFPKPTKGVTRSTYKPGETLFVSGDLADAVFYLEQGTIKKTHVSSGGKERVVAIYRPNEFVGVGCVAGRAKRLMSAAAMTSCSVTRIEKAVMLRALFEQPVLAEMFISYLISRNSHYEEDLAGHLFNPSEKRLARTLFLLSDTGKEGDHDRIVPKVSQETLAAIVGTTRSRINYFLNKFRSEGLIECRKTIRLHPHFMDMVRAESAGYQDN
jgi:CRP/FNR family cyclic AMP-dependent transcriptional regulator